LETLRLACNQAIQRRIKGLFKTEQFAGLYREVSLFFWKLAQLLTPNHRLSGELASSNQPQPGFFKIVFFRKMIRRVIVSDYLTINCHAAFVPYSTMY